MNRPDTWGIPGPVFLIVYAVLALAALAWVLTAQRRGAGAARRPSTTPTDRRRGRPGIDEVELSPAELGMLVSDRHAVVAALTELRLVGLLDASGLPARPLTDADRARLDLFTRSVLTRMEAGDGAGRPDLRVPFAHLRESLRARGLLAGEVAGLDRLPLFLVVVLGVVRVGAGLANGKPIGFLVVMVVLVGLAAALVPFLRRRRTPEGGRRYREAVRDYAFLAPSRALSATAYGPRVTAMGAAIFGMGVLALADPFFAAAASTTSVLHASGVAESSASGSDTGSFTGSSDGGVHGGGGGGSSCGGGGGSSCGGGGGCGG